MVVGHFLQLGGDAPFNGWAAAGVDDYSGCCRIDDDVYSGDYGGDQSPYDDAGRVPHAEDEPDVTVHGVWIGDVYGSEFPRFAGSVAKSSGDYALYAVYDWTRAFGPLRLLFDDHVWSDVLHFPADYEQ